MQIGKLKLDAPLVLAPMAGITDLPFRLICRRFRLRDDCIRNG